MVEQLSHQTQAAGRMAQDLLLWAAQYGDMEEAVSLVRRGARADAAMPPTNTTPLHAACRAQDLKMVAFLLSARADPNVREARGVSKRALE